MDEPHKEDHEVWHSPIPAPANKMKGGAFFPPSMNAAAEAIRSNIDSLSFSAASQLQDNASSPLQGLQEDVMHIASAIRRLRPDRASYLEPQSSQPMAKLNELKAQVETCHELLSKLCLAFANTSRERRQMLNRSNPEYPAQSRDLKQLIRYFETWAGEHFAAFEENRQEIELAISQSSEAENRASPAQRPATCAVEPPLARRVVPNTEVARAAATVQIRYEAAQRIEAFHTHVGGRGQSVNPPENVCVTPQHVELALKAMLPSMPGASVNCLSRVAPPDIDGLFVPGKTQLHDVETAGPGRSEPRFEPAITLTPKGRQLLASYYARKYAADIVFSKSDMHAEFAPDQEFIERCRQNTDTVVRSALYLGHQDNMHGSLLVYTREGDQEALLWFDSSAADASNLGAGLDLAKAAARFALDGKPIKVFQHVRAIQKDLQSCWIYAMKTAVTLTGRQPDGSGGFNDFLVPDLIHSLEARRLKTPVPEGVNPVWALPEVIRASQVIDSVLADAGEDLDKQLRGAKPGVTLRSFLEKYTYTTRDGTQTLDYIRQKGYRAIENAETQAWSQQIGKALGKDVWTITRQNEFAEQIKTQVRGRREDSVQINIGLLHTFDGDPAQFIWEGLNAHSQIHQELCNASEMAQLSLEDVERHTDRAIGLLDDLGAKLEQCFEGYRNARIPVAIEKFREQITAQLQGSRDMAAALKEASRNSKRNNLALLDSLRSAGKQELAKSIEGLAATSLRELVSEMMNVLTLMTTSRMGLAGHAAHGFELHHASDARLEAYDAELVMQAQALQLALDRFHQVTDSLPPQRATTAEDAQASASDTDALNALLNDITEDLFRKQLDLGQEHEGRARARMPSSAQAMRPHQG
jgi:hypothetical protein